MAAAEGLVGGGEGGVSAQAVRGGPDHRVDGSLDTVWNDNKRRTPLLYLRLFKAEKKVALSWPSWPLRVKSENSFDS